MTTDSDYAGSDTVLRHVAETDKSSSRRWYYRRWVNDDGEQCIAVYLHRDAFHRHSAHVSIVDIIHMFVYTYFFPYSEVNISQKNSPRLSVDIVTQN